MATVSRELDDNEWARELSFSKVEVNVDKGILQIGTSFFGQERYMPPLARDHILQEIQ